MPQTSLVGAVNRQLFSTDYLMNKLQRRSEWQARPEDREKLLSVANIYHHGKELLETGNERQVRDEIINQILALLDHHFLPDQPLRTGVTPDYIFFPDHGSKARKDILHAIAVGEAKEP